VAGTFGEKCQPPSVPRPPGCGTDFGTIRGMPRPLRVFPDGIPQHIVNRGNRRATVFTDAADFLGFLAALADAADRTTVRLVAFCLMPNHWHLVLWPVRGCEVSAYMQLAMNAHIRDLQRRHGTTGTGHIYQGRFKNSAILSERQFVNVCRYVEANPVAAGLVRRAEEWRWSSLVLDGPAEDVRILTPWPCPRPRPWLAEVNRPQSAAIERQIKRNLRRRSDIARALPRWTDPKVAGTFVEKCQPPHFTDPRMHGFMDARIH
jgi:putative transposase